MSGFYSSIKPIRLNLEAGVGGATFSSRKQAIHKRIDMTRIQHLEFSFRCMGISAGKLVAGSGVYIGASCRRTWNLLGKPVNCLLLLCHLYNRQISNRLGGGIGPMTDTAEKIARAGPSAAARRFRGSRRGGGRR